MVAVAVVLLKMVLQDLAVKVAVPVEDKDILLRVTLLLPTLVVEVVVDLLTEMAVQVDQVL
jgi:hypothetical protein